MNQEVQPLLSIIIPVKDNLSGLQKTLDVVFALNQPTKLIELIVIDGGGCRHTEQFLLENQHRIHHIRSATDSGIYHAMNYGKGCATAPWVWFCGAGDLPVKETWLAFLPEMKSWAADELHVFGVDLGHEREIGVPSHYPPRWDESLIWRNTTHHQGVIYPREVIQASDFKPAYSILADYAMHLHFWSAGVQASLHDATWSLIETGGVSRNFGVRLYWQEWKLKRRTIRGWKRAVQPFWLLIKFGFKKSGIHRTGAA